MIGPILLGADPRIEPTTNIVWEVVQEWETCNWETCNWDTENKAIPLTKHIFHICAPATPNYQENSHIPLEDIHKNPLFQILSKDNNEQQLKTIGLYIGHSKEKAYKTAVSATVKALQTNKHKIDIVTLTIPENIDQRLYEQELENTFPNPKKTTTCSL